MSVLIKSGRVVTAVDDYRADIFVDGETVALIGRDLAVSCDRVIDASGRLVIPGGVDPHTHMGMPFGGATSTDHAMGRSGAPTVSCSGSTTAS